MTRTFTISDDQTTRIDACLKTEVYPAVIEKQRQDISDPHPIVHEVWEMGYPYEGAIGGGVTYEFSPTSLGVVMKVKYGDFELDISDYDMW